MFKKYILWRWVPSLLQNATSDIEPVNLIDLNFYCSFTNSSKKRSEQFLSYLSPKLSGAGDFGKVYSNSSWPHSFFQNFDYNPFSNSRLKFGFIFCGPDSYGDSLRRTAHWELLRELNTIIPLFCFHFKWHKSTGSWYSNVNSAQSTTKTVFFHFF